MTRQQRAKMAQETVGILDAGFYLSPSAQKVNISDHLRTSVEQTRIVQPDEWPALQSQIAPADESATSPAIEVTAETTLAALHRLVVHQRGERVAALNFASAKNPGGGFLGGSQAQEESLARSSALFATLDSAKAYYDMNRKSGTPIFTDHAIFSPDVPIFRDDSGALLEQPYIASFITMPAVNAGAIPQGSTERSRVAEVMEHRIRCVLTLAAIYGTRELILGAWGCGVFRNDPNVIASLFAKVLHNERAWHSCFSRIVFAVFDPTPDGINRQPFDRKFTVCAR